MHPLSLGHFHAASLSDVLLLAASTPFCMFVPDLAFLFPFHQAPKSAAFAAVQNNFRSYLAEGFLSLEGNRPHSSSSLPSCYNKQQGRQ